MFESLGQTESMVERELRKLKGEEYTATSQVVDVAFENTSGERVNPDEYSFDELIICVGVETENGRRLLTNIKAPESWDLTEELVVILEYLEMEPEEFHTLRNSAEVHLPVKFDFEEEEYRLDFDLMRDAILADDE